MHSTDQATDVSQPFEILRNVPFQLTKRVQSISDAAKDREQTAQGDLMALRERSHGSLKYNACLGPLICPARENRTTARSGAERMQ